MEVYMKYGNKNFVMVLIGQIISLFGNGIIRFAIPIYLLNETGSAALFGLVSASCFIPLLLLMPIGGILADRLNKRNIMIILDFSTAIIVLGYMFSLGRINLVLLTCITLIILCGIQGTYQPAVQASIPSLLKQENLIQGNAMINLVNSLSNLLSPIAGGILFGLFGIKPILIISIICFFASAIMEIFISIPYTKQKSDKNMIATGIDDFKESLHFMIKTKPEIFEIGIVLAVFNFVIASCIIIGLPTIIIKGLGFSMETGNKLLGFANGFTGLGSIMGGIMSGFVSKKIKIRQAPWLLIASGVAILPIAVALFLSINPYVSYIIIVVSTFVTMSVSTMFSIMMITSLQIIVPQHLMGKIMSCAISLSMCVSPIGQAIYGVLFQAFMKNSYLIIVVTILLNSMISIFTKSSFKKMDLLVSKEIIMAKGKICAEV